MAAKLIYLTDIEFEILAANLRMNKQADSLNLDSALTFMREDSTEEDSTISNKYEWSTPDTKSDKQFLQWIWCRLHQVFGERDSLDYMKRLDEIIAKMPGSNQRLDVTDDGKWDIYRKGKLVYSDPE